jgi:hypothetical protein
VGFLGDVNTYDQGSAFTDPDQIFGTFIHFYRPPVFWVCPNTFVPGGLFMVKPHLKHYRNAERSEGSPERTGSKNKAPHAVIW